MTFTDGGGAGLGTTWIIVFYGSNLAYATIAGSNVQKCDVSGGIVGTCTTALAIQPGTGSLFIKDDVLFCGM